MRLRFLLLMMLAPALAVWTACGDHVTDPDGLVDSAEAEAVMRSAAALPLLPHFLDAHDGLDGRQRATLLRARELWDAGTAAEDPRGPARRRIAVGYAVPTLLDAVPADDWTDARAQLGGWMTTASGMLRHVALPEVEARIEAAGQQLRRSDAAVTERARIYHLLLAGSDLVETTPRFVARTMARRAEGVVRRAAEESEHAVAPNTLERAQRLKDWAARAVDEGEYLLAIQRAYYAIQLVEEP